MQIEQQLSVSKVPSYDYLLGSFLVFTYQALLSGKSMVQTSEVNTDVLHMRKATPPKKRTLWHALYEHIHTQCIQRDKRYTNVL